MFQYSAVDNRGKTVSGFLEVESAKEARGLVRRQGLLLTKLTSTRGKKKERLDKNFVLPFTLQLSELLESGLPTYESLLCLKEQYAGKKEHALFVRLAEKVRSGKQLSTCLSEEAPLFDSCYVAMVAAGEQGGHLAATLKELTLLQEKQQERRKQYIGALIYPSLLGVVCLAVLSLLFFFVVPGMQLLFEDKESKGITRLVLQTSMFVHTYAIEGLLGLTALGAFFFRKRGWFFTDTAYTIYLKIPLVKQVILKGGLARFFRTLAALQMGGVALVDALRMSKHVLKCPPLEALVADTIEAVIAGATLAQEFAKSKEIPSLAKQLLLVAEEAGNHTGAFKKLAEIYEKDTEKLLTRLTTLIQPIMLIVMGLIIGTVMMAVLLPLADMGMQIQ